MNSISKLWDERWRKVEDLESFLYIEKSKNDWTSHHFNLVDNKLGKLPEGSFFLEAGCGLGQWCIYASQKYGIKSIGVDIAINTLKKLDEYIKKNDLEKVEFLRDDLNDTKLPDDTFDFFTCLGVIEHYYYSKKLVDNLFKVTKRNGEGLVSVHNLYSLHLILMPCAKLLNKWEI